MIAELFAGPGGWSEGLRRNGRTDAVGIEIDPSAVATATRNGHQRLRGDVYGTSVARFMTRFGPVDGVVASPPCGGLSVAGFGLGKHDLQAASDLLAEIIDHHHTGGEDPRTGYLMDWHDLRSPLLVEPMRWALATDARFMVLEQVPAAVGMWEQYAEHLTGLGWSTWVAVVDAADYGVPQNRRRALLAAHRYQPVALPAPTHGPAGHRPHVSMGEHLGLEPQPVSWRTTQMTNAAVRSLDQPAPTLAFGHEFPRWVPGFEKTRADWNLGVPVTVDDAGQLQTFPAGYVWAGTRTDQFLQIANAVPPTLAAAVLAPVLAADAEHCAKR